MNNEYFEKMLGERIAKINSVLGNKAKEYAMGGDRLANFKTAARMKGESVPVALWGMAAKHLVSVNDLIAGQLKNTGPMVDEKIGDLINYLILLEAVFAEQRYSERQISEIVHGDNWVEGETK